MIKSIAVFLMVTVGLLFFAASVIGAYNESWGFCVGSFMIAKFMDDCIKSITKKE